MIPSWSRFCKNVAHSVGSDFGTHSSTVSRASGKTTDMIKRIVFSESDSFRPPQRDFEDRRRILFRSGKGGNPAPDTVRGQKKNGPAFGGHGGSVYLRASAKLESLSELPSSPVLSADVGGDGNKYSRGIHARDLVVEVPLGTIVRERVKTGQLTAEGRGIYAPRFVYQFLKDRDEFLLCQGGPGGLAPLTFKKGDGRKGAPGVRKSIDLELRLVNDIALIGVPNSGKSSIISALTCASTQIGPEPYTTTRPHLGTLRFRDGQSVRIVDLPGVSKNDATDKLRGMRILRHAWRSKLIMYCVNISSEDPFSEIEMLREELKMYDSKNERKEVIIATKCDLLHNNENWTEILDSLAFKSMARWGVPVIGTSARFGLGIRPLVAEIRATLFPQSLEIAPNRIDVH